MESLYQAHYGKLLLLWLVVWTLVWPLTYLPGSLEVGAWMATFLGFVNMQLFWEGLQLRWGHRRGWQWAVLGGMVGTTVVTHVAAALLLIPYCRITTAPYHHLLETAALCYDGTPDPSTPFFDGAAALIIPLILGGVFWVFGGLSGRKSPRD